MRCEWIDDETSCGTTSQSLSNLNQHLSEHLDSLRASFQPSSHSSLRQVRSTRKYTCPWANCEYSIDAKNLTQLSLHIYFHGFHSSLQTAGINYIRHKGLPLCHQRTNDLSSVIQDTTQPYRCEWNDGKCKQEFMFPADYYLHLWEHGAAAVSSHSNGLECKWHQCKYATPKRSSFQTHLKMHTQEKIISCPSCYKLFSTNPCLEDHLYRQAAPSSLYACDICRKQFSTERILKSHLNKHINNKQCSLCGFTLLDDSHLQRHMLFKHNDKRTHHCSTCKKSFKSKDVLERHATLHQRSSALSETPTTTDGTTKKYVCHLCDKKFVHCSYLGRHLSHYHKLERKFAHKRRRKFKFMKQMDGLYRLADESSLPSTTLANSFSYRCHVCHLIFTEGYSRFRYHKNADGFHELVMFRIESKTLHLDS